MLRAKVTFFFVLQQTIYVLFEKVNRFDLTVLLNGTEVHPRV